MHTALVQVLGAVAYGELKAFEGAKAEAEAATDPAVRRRSSVGLVPFGLSGLRVLPR